ncbi:MAG: hypothetical protein FWH17_06850 [Oscillospiraceae bacterium]|nr:hypothetical protein [Oscillospiraceae bacterium]
MRGLSYEYATEKDGEEIAALLEDAEFKGGISIAYCRRPNAVLSLSRDGDKSTLAIARNADGKLVGVGGCTINGDVAYLTGLRAVVPGNIPKAYQLIWDFCAENGVKLTYTTILEDNVAVQKMLEKKRANMPYYLRHSELVTNIIRKKLRVKDKNTLTLEEDGFYVLRGSFGNELARGKAVEQWDYKQYVIKKYGWQLRLLKPFVKWFPNENEVLKFFTLREVAANDSIALESFLRHISRIPSQSDFFLYGGSDCPVKAIKYKSIVYIVDWDKAIEDVSSIQLNVEIADL